MVRRFQFAALTASLLLALQAGPAAAAQGVASRIVAGGHYTCALTATGGVKCWGTNAHGQLGDGTATRRLIPVDVVGLTSGVTAVAAGSGHACALTAAGAIKCWGDNTSGQLGDGTTAWSYTPVDVLGLSSGVTAIAAGGFHTCALTAAGAVKCWGYNDAGQVGDGTTIARRTPVDVSGLGGGVGSIDAGTRHTCAVTDTGAVKCWGLNNEGQLGDGTTIERHTPVGVFGLDSGVTAVAAGSIHTCALTDAGAAKCWAVRVGGLTPIDVVGLSSGVTAIAAGWHHTCALTAAGAAKCWGGNPRGELGDGTTTNRPAPVGVFGLSGVTAIAAGPLHTCALTLTGDANCWGENGTGQLGDGTTIDRLTPITVQQFHAAGRALVAAGSGHTCGVTSGGVAKCWGHNQFGQLGDGTNITSLTPVDVSGLGSGINAMAAGSGHTCRLTSEGGVKCWGRNLYGQLGDGTNTTRLTPVDVSELGSGGVAVAAGHYHSCALTVFGRVRCWGDNKYGQLGTASRQSRRIPVELIRLRGRGSAIALGGFHTCVLIVAGRNQNDGVKCWGKNDAGQIGDGTAMERLAPVDVTGLGSVVFAIAAGGAHTCAVTSVGGVKCWGKNNAGQLGDGTTTDRLTPVDVAGLGSVVFAIAAGESHTCALTAVGGIKCWGLNTYGQLGDGTTTQRLMPVDVSGLAGGVAAIAAGYSHTCAITDTSKAKCWGDNTFGQLGSGTRRFRLTPVNVSGF